MSRRQRTRSLVGIARVGALLSPALVILAVDLLRRPTQIAHLHGIYRWLWLATVVVSLLFWPALLYVAASRRGFFRRLAGFAFVLFFTCEFAVQNAFFSHFRIYSCLDAVLFSDSIVRGIISNLPFDQPPLALFAIGSFFLSLSMLQLARRWVRPRARFRRWAPLVAIPIVVIGFSIPLDVPVYRESASPDLMYFNSIAVLINDKLKRKIRHRTFKPLIVRIQHRTPEAVPALVARPSLQRNVVLLLQEAQRADVTCIGYDPNCQLSTRASNALLPNRIPFFQARSIASSTSVSVLALWAGIDPTESYERVHSAPLIWDYAAAAGYDGAYWSSQGPVFGNYRLFTQDVPVSFKAMGSNLDPESNSLYGARDELVAERAISELPKLKEPFVAVVQFTNIHRSRLIDPARAPFQPTFLEDKGIGVTEGRNYYKNAVYLSDLAVAKVIQFLRTNQAGKRTVIVYTADHGEAYGEHKNENDHSATVYDEEIRVPLWIDAPAGTLTPEETDSLLKNRYELVTHYDVSATLFDLLGLWDTAAFEPFRSRMLGTPLTRALPRDRLVPLTNVSWVWEYHRANWGLMRGPLKVLATPDDSEYQCYNVLADPREVANRRDPGCPALIAEAHAKFAILPRDLHRLRAHPDWGEHRELQNGGRVELKR